MRLIDADKLKKDLTETHINMKLTFDIATFNCVMNTIDNAPEVTPTLQLKDITDEDVAKFVMIWQRATSKGLILEPERPQGKWITHQTGLLLWDECNQCHAQVGTLGMPYCPNCGAKMKGEEE